MTQHYEKLMRVKRQRIRDQFKSLDFFYANKEKSRAAAILPRATAVGCGQGFSKHTMDDIELAEIFEKEWGEKAITEPQEKIDDAQLDKLVKFVDWAVKRGGGALNDAKTKKEEELTEEEREMRKPFWARTYFIGASKREFRLDRDFINAYMQRASHMVKDNESAYHDYKRGRLFPRIMDSS